MVQCSVVTHAHTLLCLCVCMQDLLYRRMRSLANYEAANKKLENAKSKGKAVAEVWSRVAKSMPTSSPKQSTIVLVPIPCCTVVWSPYHAVLYSGPHSMLYYTIHIHTFSRLKRSNKLVAPNLRSFLRQANKVHGSQSS